LESGNRDYNEWSPGDEASDYPVAVAVATYDAEAFLAISTRAGVRAP